MSYNVITIKPNQISNLFFHYDSSLLLNFSGGTKISTFVDQINGNNFIQLNPTSQYSIENNSQNGYPSVVKPSSFTGYTNSNGNIENIWSGNTTMFIAGLIPPVSVPQYLISSGAFNNGSTGGFELIVVSNFGGSIAYRELLNIETFPVTLVNYNTGKTNVISLNLKRGDKSYITINNNRKKITDNLPNYNQSIFDNISLGSSNKNTGAIPQGFKLFEMLIYNRSLSFEEESKVNRYLKFKWNI